MVALDDGLAMLLVAVAQHQRPHAQAGRPQPVRVRVVAHVQPAVPAEVVAVAQQFVALARGLGEEGVGRGDHRVHLVAEAGVADQPLQVGGGEVDVGDYQHPLAGRVQRPQPVHQPGSGHEHGVFDGQFVVGHLVEQGVGVLLGEDALQGPAHEVRVAGLVVLELLAGLTALAHLDPVAQPLHLRPGPGEPGLGRTRGDVAGHRRLDHVRVVDTADEEGVEQVERDGVAVGRHLFAGPQQFVEGVEGLPAHRPSPARFMSVPRRGALPVSGPAAAAGRAPGPGPTA